MFLFGYERPFPQTDEQYFQHINCPPDVPITDVAAFKFYPHLQWIYNKLVLSQQQNITAYPDGICPPSFPVFRKPIINLMGMSIGAGVVRSATEYYNVPRPGYFIMPVLSGTQYTTDIALDKGEIMWYSTFEAHKDENGSFTLFEKVNTPTYVFSTLQKWIARFLQTFTGIVNFETISDVIIECHLRMSSQFVDLYGDDWLQSVISLYENKGWTPIHDEVSTAYSIPLRISNTKPFNHLTPTIINKAKQLCKSVQVDLPEDTLYNDNTTIRLAVVNGTDMVNCQLAANILYEYATNTAFDDPLTLQ